MYLLTKDEKENDLNKAGNPRHQPWETEITHG